MVHCTIVSNFFADGKPWRMSHPGKGQAVRELCTAAGTDDFNLMQHAYYNGHYKYHRAKVQHVLQADGMVYCLRVQSGIMMPWYYEVLPWLLSLVFFLLTMIQIVP